MGGDLESPLKEVGARMTEAEVEEAYRRFGPLVMRRCRRILGSEAAAKDALQETFLRLWRHGDGFAAASSKLGWLYRVAERCCFDHLSRRATRRATREAADATPGAAAD